MYSQSNYWNQPVKWFSFQDAKERLGDPLSSFVLFRCKRHMVLSPQYLGKVKKGVKEQLNAELKLYCNRLLGVLVAYDNISILQTAGNIHDEEPCIHFDIEADFVVFRPNVGCTLRGVVNKVSRDHIGCLVHGCFNASIPKPRNKDTWQDVSTVTTGVELEFEVTGFSSHNRILSLHGVLKSYSLQHLQSSSKKQKRKLSLNESQNEFGLNNDVRNSSTSGSMIDSQHKKSKKQKKHEGVSFTPIDVHSITNPGSTVKKQKKQHKEMDSGDRTSTVNKPSTMNSVSPPKNVELEMKPRKKRKKKHREIDLGNGNIAVNEGSSINVQDEISPNFTDEKFKNKIKKAKVNVKAHQDVSQTGTLSGTLQNSSGLFDSGIDLSALVSDSSVSKVKSKKRKKKEDPPKYEGSSENESVLVFQDTILPGSSLVEFSITDSQESDISLSKKHKKKNKHKDRTVRS